MNRKKMDVELALLTLQYERQVSRAHTIFSSFWDIFFGIIVGTMATVIGLIEIGAIEFHKLAFILVIIVILFIIAVVGIVAFYQWYESKIERNKIEQRITNLAI